MIFPENIENFKYDALIDGKMTTMKITDMKSKYIILIFYPLDFTFVCPTEIKKLSEMHDEFKKCGASIIYASGDSIYSHLAWTKLSPEENGIGRVKWPMISDKTGLLSKQFNLYDTQKGQVQRGTVILDKDLNVKHLSANSDPIGRSSRELLRLVKAIEFHAVNGEVCPIDFE